MRTRIRYPLGFRRRSFIIAAAAVEMGGRVAANSQLEKFLARALANAVPSAEDSSVTSTHKLPNEIIHQNLEQSREPRVR